jgi:hypothetical protein
MQAFTLAFVVLATVKIAGLTESSGLAASQRYPGVFWTINDGPTPFLFAFDRSGTSRARVRVAGGSVFDWEALSIGPGPAEGRSFLYIGDIGDNRQSRRSIQVYRVEEPDLGNTQTKPAEKIQLQYPDGSHDAEAILVHPTTGDLYIVIKSNERNLVYKAKAPLSTSRPIRLQRVGDAQLPEGSFLTKFVGRVTGGDISPDGKKVILCDYDAAWESVASGRDFDSVWKGPWRRVDIAPRQQGEAVSYRHDGKTVLATSEGKEFPLVEAESSR